MTELLAQVRHRVAMMLARGLLLATDDDRKVQTIQASFLSDETLTDIERFQNYGVTSHAPIGSEVLTLFLGGNRDHGISFAVGDRQYRLKGLSQGEVALYDDQGQVVHIKRNGVSIAAKNIHLNAAGTVRIEGDGVEIHGREYVQTDVQGLGERRTHDGGVDYTDDTYTLGAAIAAVEHGVDQPELASEHPDKV